MLTFFLIIFSYLLGSISGAILCCRLAGLADPRQRGSKNAGATNVMRIGGKGLAAMVFLTDLLKGVLAVGLAAYFLTSDLLLGVIALTVTLGHIYPIYFGFAGGKGVATAFGALVILSWPIALAALCLWSLTFYFYRYVSLASVLATASIPLMALYINLDLFFPLLAIAILIVFKHHENLSRLVRGEEKKLKL